MKQTCECLKKISPPLSFAVLSPTFSFSLYSKFVEMTIYLSLILQTKRIQKQFPLSIFVFIDSLVVSASQDAGGYEISRQNNLEFPYLLIELLYIGMPLVRTDGRSVYDHVITRFSRMDMGLRVRGAPLQSVFTHVASIYANFLEQKKAFA